MARRPAPELDISEKLVRSLLEVQHRDLAERHLVLVDRGWDNTTFGLGDNLAVRLPHRQAAAALIENEQRWLELLAPQLPLPIPAPLRRGVPGPNYPWHWSVVPWFDGAIAAEASLSDPRIDAQRLGEFLKALHRPAPADAPKNPHRGTPLSVRAEAFEDRRSDLAQRRPDLPLDALADVFTRAVDADQGPDTERARRNVWMHGDLHTLNMLVANDALAAIIDWGDLCVGDPSSDLAASFMLVPDHIDVVADHCGASTSEWERARGWAAHFAVLYIQHGDDAPAMRRVGERLIATLTAARHM